jgi:hypothetical protein
MPLFGHHAGGLACLLYGAVHLVTATFVQEKLSFRNLTNFLFL